MSNVTRHLRLLSLTLAGIALSGCITLLPQDKPAQLYRFGGRPPAASSAQPSAQFGISRAAVTFLQAASSDRILTMNGSRAAYIAGSRWVSPAPVLFNEALTQAFDANTGAARLLARGEIGKAAYSMRLDIIHFEAVYDRGEKAAPNIVVSVRATLVKADRTLGGSKLIEAQVRAGDNRVGAIVAAFDDAVGQVLNELVAWTNGLGAP